MSVLTQLLRNRKALVGVTILAIVILLVAWAIVAVVGFAIEGLLWIAIIGIILFIGTILFGVIRNRTPKA